MPAFDVRAQVHGEHADGGADDGGGHPDDERPGELGAVRVVEGRQVRDGQREVPTPGRRADADEDQGADAGGQQPGEQHQRGRGTAEPDRLHQQERSEQRGAQEGGDGREAARRRR